LPDTVPAPLRALVSQLLEKAEAARPRSVALVVAELERVARRPFEPRRRWWPWVVGPMAVLGVLAVTTFALHSQPPDRSPVRLEATPLTLPDAPQLKPAPAPPEPPPLARPLPAPVAQPLPVMLPPERSSASPGVQASNEVRAGASRPDRITLKVGETRVLPYSNVSYCRAPTIAALSIVGSQFRLTGRVTGVTYLHLTSGLNVPVVVK
jgi:hypothetical protein